MFGVAVAELKAEAAHIESQTELECQTLAREAENAFLREQNNLEVSKAKALSKVEVSLVGLSDCVRPNQSSGQHVHMRQLMRLF